MGNAWEPSRLAPSLVRCKGSMIVDRRCAHQLPLLLTSVNTVRDRRRVQAYSMPHKDRQFHQLQYPPGGATEHPFTEACMAIGPHDEHIGADIPSRAQ